VHSPTQSVVVGMILFPRICMPSRKRERKIERERERERKRERERERERERKSSW
jgi:hypothetical protein